MESKFSNMALEVIAAKPEIDSTLLEVVYRVSTKIDSDLSRLELMMNGSGYQGMDPAASVYRSAIDVLQLFNGLFDDNKPLKTLFDEMWSAVYEYESKV
ncbi:hypothetical protein FWP33_18780 [Vibrio parahaemolyticus]|uniref:Phage protein n=1 Tax=Vibrio jasicida TaxID=766224 RepID=A0AAU9QSZ2_9VIBR|nr:hypothetical protein [Vibrio parahaemolyticus]EJE4724662.1 hypothetical protein [Vibrio parahaemolyticus]EJO2026025.1 hypothetical protein [Vibrio parahaemolyticus]CAH1598999.1 hypothetical protein THF1C08_50339 [Vibrio jasicida]CAH1601366.1 hypothetical protein THF1A12_50006 [Vibrio jasicida]